MRTRRTLQTYIKEFNDNNFNNLEAFLNDPNLLIDSKYKGVLKDILKNFEIKIKQGEIIPDWENVRPAIEKLIERSTISLESLDLDTHLQEIPKKKPILMLIKSLRDNYEAYCDMMLQKEKKSSLDNTFFGLGLLEIPRMKDNEYKHWEEFVRRTRKFLDIDSTDFLNEMQKLEIKISELSAESPDKPIDIIFEQILEDFEREAGFDNVVDIPKEAKVLSADEFNKILSEGHPFNDLGASPQHGKWSHRLQIYLLGKYVENHFEEFFDISDPLLKEKLGLKEGEKINLKLLSEFYRLLGTKKFNDSFMWTEFRKARDEYNQMYNPGKTVHPRFNPSVIWSQLFDRLGYAGYFSVPSTFGFLQELGAFSALPKIGKPNIYGESKDKHLKTTLDVTPRLSSHLFTKRKKRRSVGPQNDLVLKKQQKK